MNNNLIEVKNEIGYISYYRNDYFFAKEAENNLIWDQEVVLTKLSSYIKNSSVIFDIGAHCGSHTILYKHINNKSKIFSFEPQKAMYALLCKNIKKNNLQNVKTFNFALSNKVSYGNMSSYVIDGPNTKNRITYKYDKNKEAFNLGGIQIGEGGEKIKISTIDSLEIDKVDFIKIDVEGFEPLVIDGGINTILRNMPIIYFEYGTKIIDSFPNPKDILSKNSYKIIKIEDCNYLAIPNK